MMLRACQARDQPGRLRVVHSDSFRLGETVQNIPRFRTNGELRPRQGLA